MSELKCEVLEHDLTQRVFDIGWFPDRLSGEERRSLSAAGFRACEVRVSGIGHRDDRYDTAQTFLKQLAHRCLLHMGSGFMLFKSLSKYGARSRVRTYKGVFPWLGASLRDLKAEFERDRHGESLIGGILVVREPWFEESWREVGSYQRSVLLLADSPVNTAPESIFVERIMRTLEGEEAVWIDYPRLVSSCVDAGNGVLRRGGNAGETFVNLTLFSGPAKLKQFEEQVEDL